MDAISLEKLLAMNRYKRRQLFPTLMLYLMSTLFLGLFLSSPIWIPWLCSSFRFFFLISIPNMITTVFTPKFLFILCNLIIAFLVGEFRFSRPSSPVHDVYEEYMKRNAASEQSSANGGMKACILGMALVEGKEERDGEWEEETKGEVEDLHRRVVDYIARVKLQRKQESFLCYS